MESEVVSIAFRGVEMMVHIGQACIKTAQEIAAFFVALAKQTYTVKGKQSLKTMLKSGEPLIIGEIPYEKADEFVRQAKKYGLAHHDVIDKDKKTFDVMFKSSDMSKFHTACERAGILEDDIKLSKFNVGETRESIREDLENYVKQRSKDGPEPAIAHHAISEMSDMEIQSAVKGVGGNIADSFTPDNWKAYLEMQSMLYKYSDRNQDKIRAAGGTLVMSKTKWRELGRDIAPDAKGIEIKMPALNENGKPIPGQFKDVLVYDVTETAGQDIDMDQFFVRIKGASLDKLLDSYKKGRTIVASDEFTENVRFDPQTDTYYVKEGLTKDEQLKGFVRESVYESCFKEQGEAFSRDKNAMLAESAAYAVATKCGIDASEYQFEYLEEMAKEAPQELFAAKETVTSQMDSFNEMLKDIEKSFTKTRTTESRVI